ncbi:hypothetical protein QUF75_08290 [Desulfococcaceae bacterium HSG7]|nr:hypothetical protein [Desulfococcaceae bacterium HSG7]
MQYKSNYLKWKLKTFYNRFKIKKLYDPLKIYWIDPVKIQTSLSHPNLDRTNPKHKQKVSPMFERGMIMGGDWDINAIPFQKMDVWQAFEEYFIQGVPWNKTAFYQRVLKTINNGIPLWYCRTEGDFTDRLENIERLYNRIKKNGYRMQSEINNSNIDPLCIEDEINIHIGRNGEYIFGDGRHRLCIAKLLKLDKIPVKIARRHEKWVYFRKDILEYAKKHKGKIWEPLIHPDLSDIPSHNDDYRMKIIKENIASSASGKMLEVGAHWGYFSHCFSKIGFHCTAIENSPENIYYLKRLKDINRVDFQIFEGSVLDFDNSKTEYDVTLSLNKSHYRLKDKEYFEKYIRWLSSLKTKLFFFEFHQPDENHKNDSSFHYSPDKFINIIQKVGHFKKNKIVGHFEDNRRMYLLEQ